MKHRRILYILKGYLAVPVSDQLEWGRWFETADRRVALTEVGPLEVSTVFLGLDHGYGRGFPLIFETIIFNGEELYMDRYSSWQEAEAGHAKAIEVAKEMVEKAVEMLPKASRWSGL